MKKICDIGLQVSFDFGSIAYVTVTLYEGKTLAECLKMRSEHIDGYVRNGKFAKIA